MSDVIPVYTRDDSKDYLNVLKAINEIPFPVGKNLLSEFLTGSYTNKSVMKNDLFELHNFNSLRYEKEEVLTLIKSLIAKGLISVESSPKNKFWKVLHLTEKGRNELIKPKVYKNSLKNKIDYDATEITEKEKEEFEKYPEFLSKFNKEQKKAIISNKKNILCIAGAGSGKTTVLTKRVEFLIKYKNVPSEKILAITFTRKARNEMKKRLKNSEINVKIETFNSFCEKILRKYENKIYDGKVKVEGYREKLQSMMSALNSLGITMEQAINTYFTEKQIDNNQMEKLANILINDCFFILDYFKSHNKELYDFSKDSDNESAKMIYDLCKKLEKNRIDRGLRSFTDQILDTINFFMENPDLIPEFNHVLVDEYQDVNAMQEKIIDLLNPENLFCVGDPRQSIFGWRGSDINFILNFPKKYGNAETITLTKNYRSNNNIVKLMNYSIQSLGLPDLEHNFENDKQIILKKFNDETEEFNFIIEKIKNSNVDNSEIFVLARTNRQLNDLSKLLQQNQIPHTIKSEDDSVLEKNKVVLATIHSIKGMEAELVFVIGANNQNFPCKASDHPIIEMIKVEEYDKEEEEKRLFYVAISRAKNILYITHTNEITYFVNKDMLEFADS